MRRVIIESPYAGDINSNIHYAKLCLRDSINRGEAPIASHLIYPYVLREDAQMERKLGIELGFAWWHSARAICFYLDKGWSVGMIAALERARYYGKDIEFRTLDSQAPWFNRVESVGLIGKAWRWLLRLLQPTPNVDQVCPPLQTASDSLRDYCALAPEAGQSARVGAKSSPENSCAEAPPLSNFIKETLDRTNLPPLTDTGRLE